MRLIARLSGLDTPDTARGMGLVLSSSLYDPFFHRLADCLDLIKCDIAEADCDWLTHLKSLQQKGWGMTATRRSDTPARALVQR